MSNIEKEEKIELKAKNVIIDDFDFELIYSNDTNKIKELNNNNKINNSSTNVSELITDAEHSTSNTISEINSEIDKSKKAIKNDCLFKPYILLDKKNYFLKIEQKTIEQMNKKFRINYKDNNIAKSLKELSDMLKFKLLAHLFHGIKQDFFSISTFIWKSLNKDKLLKKEYIEKCLIYFYYRKYTLTEKIILINIDFIKNCGPVIAHIYKRFKNNNIKDEESFLNKFNKMIKQNVKVKYECDKYVSEKDLKPENLEFVNYFKKIRRNYIILPEIIYLIDLFSQVKEIIIDINISKKEYNQSFFYYYILCILHFRFLFKNVETIKFSTFNEAILNSIYKDNELKLNKLKNFSSYKINKTNKNIIKINKLSSKTEESFLEQFKLIDMAKTVIKNKHYGKKKSSFTKCFSEKEKQNKSNDNINNKRIIKKESKNNLSSTEFRIEDIKEISQLEFRNKILEMILITIFSFDKHVTLQNLELILVYTFCTEFMNYFNENLQLEVENFNILDLMYNKLIKLTNINLEINSFDLFTFNEILQLLYNSNPTILRLSFFTIDYIYSSPFLYKIYLKNVKEKLIKNNHNDTDCFNDIFYKNIYSRYSKYLGYLFEIIRNKKLSTISINMNIPNHIINDEKYIIIIIKFIINIFILIYNEKDSEARELSIFSTPLVINGKKYLFFDEFLQNINIRNKHLLLLNIRIKFYYIKNIYKFIPEKLKILNIGDFDIFSLKFFVNKITEYEFIKNSSLQELSIKINDTIIKFNDELKLIFAKLFNIYIQNLILYLYTNIEINSKEFKEIIFFLKNNWIFKYSLSFNTKSKKVIKENYLLIKNLNYIIPKEPIYSGIFNIKDIIEGKKDEDQKKLASFTFINWSLKNYIIKTNNSKEIDFKTYKKITSLIFRYLYTTGIPIVNFYENDI